MSESLGKRAERKIKEWLNRPEQGYCLDRIQDQLSGLYGSKNICDFTLYKYPNMYYIESKSTYENRFDFNRITDYQYDNLLKKSNIPGVYSFVIVLFATYKRAFIFDIREIDRLYKEYNRKSINITKIDKWQINYSEITTIPNTRKLLLDYTGEIEDHVNSVLPNAIKEGYNVR